MAQSAKVAAKPKVRPPTPPEQPNLGKPSLGKKVVGNQAGMYLTTPGALDAGDAHLARIRELGLEPYILEIEVRGYTVIPPKLVAPPEFTARVRDALLRLAEKRTGVKHSIDQNGSAGEGAYAYGAGVFAMLYLLLEDPVFEEWIENPVLGALVNYTLKGQGRLSSFDALVKWKDASQLDPNLLNDALHSDSPRWPDGNLLDGGNLMTNSAYILTDYSKENGSMAMVPGSHRLGRLPYPGEGVKDLVPVEAPAGSLIFWKGATWHGGAYPKLTDGLRLTMNTTFFNRSLKTVEAYQRAVPKEVLDRRNRQFAVFVGADDMSGFGPEGPQPAYLEPAHFF